MMISSDKRPLEFFSDLYQVEQYSKCSTSLNKIYKHNSLNSFFNQLKKQKKLMREERRGGMTIRRRADHTPNRLSISIFIINKKYRKFL